MDLPGICKYSRNFASFAKRKENRDSSKNLRNYNTKCRFENKKYESYWKRSRFANDLHGDKYKKRMQEEKHVSSSKGNVLFEYQ